MDTVEPHLRPNVSMFSLALFAICYALVGPGPQILILWLVHQPTADLMWSHHGQTTVLLCGDLSSLPCGQGGDGDWERQAIDSDEVAASQGEGKEEDLGFSRVEEAP